MQDAWRAYLELAFGLTEASRKKAREVAKEVLGRGGATAAQVQAFVDDLVSTSRANREELARLVRYEVDRALGAVGLATAEEVADLTNRLRELERRLSGPGAAAGTVPPAGGHAAAAPPPVKPPPAKKAVAKKAVAKKAVAKKAVAKQPASKQPAQKRAATSGAASRPAATKRSGQGAGKKAG
jgi:polyhydroxyalkanoate synthesis regulator phasin